MFVATLAADCTHFKHALKRIVNMRMTALVSVFVEMLEESHYGLSTYRLTCSYHHIMQNGSAIE